MAICQLSQLSALDNLDGAQWVRIISKRNLKFEILCIFTRCIHSSSVVLWMRVEVAVLRAVMYCSRNFHSHQNNSADLSGYSSAVECGSIFNYHISEWFLPLNSFIPWIVPALLCTVAKLKKRIDFSETLYENMVDLPIFNVRTFVFHDSSLGFEIVMLLQKWFLSIVTRWCSVALLLFDYAVLTPTGCTTLLPNSCIDSRLTP